MAGKELSKKRKAAPVASAKPKKLRKTTKVEIKAANSLDTPKTVAPVEVTALEQDDQISFEDEAHTSEPDDDQTAALLKGFESSDDDEDAGVDIGEISEIPSIPDTVALQSKLSAAASKPSDQPGVVYVGRIPHGFYEHQMRAYFSQFGEISRLRLSRNRRSGASKHFAFIEFASSEVASIVADTMDNYLMFGHLLKVKSIPKEQVHKELFKGAGTRFKKVPWNKIERFRLQGADRKGWDKRVKTEEKRRVGKAQKLKELGYVFEAPKLKEVADVPVQAVEQAPVKDIEDVPPPATVPKDEIALAQTENNGEQLKTNEIAAPKSEEISQSSKSETSKKKKSSTGKSVLAEAPVKAAEATPKESAITDKNSAKRESKRNKRA